MKSKKKNSNDLISKWSFIIGLVISVIAGVISANTTLLVVLFILGLIVGFLNIREEDSTKFLVANIALLTGGIASLSAISHLGTVSNYLTSIIGSFISFISAAALVVGIKAVFETSKK